MAMSTDFLGPNLVGGLIGGLFVAAGLTFVCTIIVTILALRAKLRARVFLSLARRHNMKLRQALDALGHTEKLSLEQVAASVTELEECLSSFSERDRDFISRGLHQPSIEGIKRFAKGLATALS
jgi:hypothetical protein